MISSLKFSQIKEVVKNLFILIHLQLHLNTRVLPLRRYRVKLEIW